MYVDDVKVVSNDRSMDVDVDVSGIKLDCTFDWVYNWFFSGSGATTSSIGISVDFISDDSTASPYPSGVEISKCETNLQIDQMKFNGGLAGGIANLVQSSVQESISRMNWQSWYVMKSQNLMMIMVHLMICWV